METGLYCTGNGPCHGSHTHWSFHPNNSACYIYCTATASQQTTFDFADFYPTEQKIAKEQSGLQVLTMQEFFLFKPLPCSKDWS
jgi:hypothetical protein